MSAVAVKNILDDVIAQVLPFLDLHSLASCSKVSQHFKKVMEEMRHSSTPIFALYLTDELLAADLYKTARESKKGAEWETFKSEERYNWFKALSDKSNVASPLLKPLLQFAIRALSKHSWSDLQIQQLCRRLRYEARQEMPGIAASWRVTEISTKKK